jgi:hypothetical protein
MYLSLFSHRFVWDLIGEKPMPNVSIHPDLYNLLTKRAAADFMPVSQATNNAIREYLRMNEPAQPPKESSQERKEARDAVLRKERSARMAAESAARFAESEAYIAKIWENAPYLSTGKKNPNYRPENPYVAPTKPDSMTAQYPSGEVPEYDNLDDILGD